MIHLFAGLETTGCCSTPVNDLPKGDTLTFEEEKVTCGTLPLRHPEPLARYVCDHLEDDSGGWDALDEGRRLRYLGLARRILWILGYPDAD